MKRLIAMGVMLSCTAAWPVSAQDVEGRKGLSEQEAKQEDY